MKGKKLELILQTSRMMKSLVLLFISLDHTFYPLTAKHINFLN